MERDQKYQSQYRSRSSAPNAQYSPLSVADATGRMQEEFNRQNADAESTQRQVEKNQETALNRLRTEAENNKQKGKDLEALGQFSQTLTEQLVGFQQERNEKELQENLMNFYINGIPGEEQEKFDKEESELAEADAAINTAGYEVGQETQQAYMERAVRGMSGWKRYAAQLYLAETAGTNYSLALATQGKDFSVDIGNGETLTFATADTLPKYQTLMNAFRRQYMSKFAGMNPALVNKYAFPAMKKAENAYAVQWGKDQETKLKSDKFAETQNLLLSGVKNGSAGQAYARAVTQLVGNYGGNRTEARKAAIDTLKNIDSLTSKDVEDILNTVDPVTGKKYKELYDGQELKKLNETIITREANKVEQLRTVRATAVAKLEEEVKKLELERDTPITLQDRQAIVKRAEEEGIDWKSSDYLKNYLSRNVEKDEDIKERLDLQLNSPNGRGFLIGADLAGASIALRKEYGQFVKDPSELKINKDAKESLDGFSKTLAKEFYGLQGESFGGNTAAFQTYERVRDNAMAKYRKYISSGMSSQEAITKVQEELKKTLDPKLELDQNPYLTKEFTTFPQQLNISVTSANQQIAEDARVIKSGKIQGSETYYNELKASAEKGQLVVPEFYHRIAKSQPNLDGWDIAAAQLKANDGIDLMAPTWKQQEQQLSPDVQRLIKNFPTVSRTTRAAYGGNNYKGDNWKQFLDLVASKESKAYGEYDAYNLGGRAGGHVAVGSGNSAEDNRYGKPLSQLTLNEVVSLGDNDKIWAAGRYQFIPSTLKETMKEAGLTGNEMFDAATQDQLAIARARWRLRSGKGMTGLRQEWIGLNYVEDPVLRNAMNGLVDTRSPYNQPKNMTPGVARHVYTTGNIGPTSTGQHLDVKRVDKGYFDYGALDNFVEVDDPELGRVPLGSVPETGDFRSHTVRGSHGRDYGTYSGSKLYLKNGAKEVPELSGPSEHGYYQVIELPDGTRYSFLHGSKPK